MRNNVFSLSVTSNQQSNANSVVGHREQLILLFHDFVVDESSKDSTNDVKENSFGIRDKKLAPLSVLHRTYTRDVSYFFFTK